MFGCGLRASHSVLQICLEKKLEKQLSSQDRTGPGSAAFILHAIKYYGRLFCQGEDGL